ncbi:hypothetical protein RJ640_020150 [Escallonia rubra]|uniref:Tryptophan aminotransferase-related protein 4 n=1 Tax=Escallonia rubra TaxID=112253 RepID=A0AA88R0B6_9ASTE|nr:hypothetical protein RJ640_020150 [Escallonia rubra]
MEMVKLQSSKCAFSLVSSIVLNLLLLFYLFVGDNSRKLLSWGSRAAAEAEAVASLSCSGHGRAYLDGLLVDGIPVCECNSCFDGPDCSVFVPGCPADVNSGDPLFLEPFWMQHAASSAILVAGWHRMSYSFDEKSSITSQELEKRIRRVHAIVGNAVTDQRFIVFGAGSTQLLNAAVHALSLDNTSSPSAVVVSAPSYPAYKEQTDFFDSLDYKFYGDTSMWKNTSDVSANVIEFVTSPNNPDGMLRKEVLQGPSARAIHDHAYYWPHFTAIPAPADEDVMVFTLSKLTGHAGSRFGWALVKDEAVYQQMLKYTNENCFGVSRDTQLRALKLLKVVLEGEGREIFGFAHKTMSDRWGKLSEALSSSKRFSIQDLAPQYCSFFQRVRGPSPAYAWFKCEREEDKDCYRVLSDAGIIGRRGTLFGAGSRYVRLSLIKRQDDFDLLLLRMRKLVAEEGRVEQNKEDSKMGKIKALSYTLCLLASIVLNLFLFQNLYVGGKWEQQLSWSQRAAAEAEAVASVSCSGHGRAYLDGSLLDGKPVCECNTCFGGPDCSEFSPECPADADSGDPLFLEPFWMQHAASSAVLVAGWHRMSYSFTDRSFISQELKKQILKVHAIAKNAVTDGKYIIYGAGSTQLLSAAVYALSMENSSSPANLVASIPYYPNTSDVPINNNVIEFVTSPNNPDGLLKKPVLRGPFVKTVNDHAYYWPHYTAIPAPADEDLMIFTASKLTGHAGSRFGWALVKDEAVYQRMLMYMILSSMGVSRDTQLRALKILKVISEGNGREIFEFSYQTMSDRWEKLSKALSKSKRFSVQQTAPQYCTFFQKVRGPSPAYAWLKCEREEDKDCSAVLGAAGIIGREGSMFSTENRYVRLSLLKSQDDFDLLLHRISKLVSQEVGVATM